MDTSEFIVKTSEEVPILLSKETSRFLLEKDGTILIKADTEEQLQKKMSDILHSNNEIDVLYRNSGLNVSKTRVYCVYVLQKMVIV